MLQEIRRRLPNQAVVYFADQHHVPYGSRSLEEVKALSEGITRFLLDQGCALIVVACNTASAAALYSLRSIFPETPFVGMEPAVKPAAERTETRKVAVLATPATFQGVLFESVVERFARGVDVTEVVAPGLVELIEIGQTESEQVEAVLRRSLEATVDQGIDTVVLACTHYSFVIPSIQRILGPTVTVIDPAPAIARQTARLWKDHELGTRTEAETSVRYLTSGRPKAFRSSFSMLIGDEINADPASWEAGSLQLRRS